MQFPKLKISVVTKFVFEGERKFKSKEVSIISITLLIINMLTLAFNICPIVVEATDGSTPPKFLTLPFSNPEIKIQQGWVYTFNPDPDAHKGIDYINGNIDLLPWYTFDVVAAAEGVAMQSSGGGYGNFVYIRHEEMDNTGNNYFTLYAHLDSIFAGIISKPRGNTDYSTWTPIKRGEILGKAGSTGVSNPTWIHLHFEVQRGGYPYGKTDPYDLYTTRDFYPEGDDEGCGPNYLWTTDPPSLPENQEPNCVIKLKNAGIELNEVVVWEFFDIYVGDSTDDFGVEQVRFSSDESQDGIAEGDWTEWYNWSDSSGDWNAGSKIKRWAFATSGIKEVCAEVKDNIGQTRCDFANISAFMIIADFSASPISGTEPLTVTFTDLSTSYNQIDSWFWNFGDGETSTDQNPIHEYIEGIYTVSLTITSTEADSDSLTKTDHINVIASDEPELSLEDATSWYWNDHTNINSVAQGDVDGDTQMEIVTGGYYWDGSRDVAQLCVLDGATLVHENVKIWYWTGSTTISSVVIGDVDNDGQVEIVTGGYYYDGSRNVAQLCIWDGSTLAFEDVTTWYWTSDTYILSVAVGDVDGDSQVEIVTGGRFYDGTRGVAQLCVWDGATLACEDVTTWYWTSSTCVVSVAVGDIDGDTQMEIITGGWFNDGSHYVAQLCTWDGAMLALEDVTTWYWGTDYTYIKSVAVGDVDGDSQMEIVTGGYYYDGSRNVAQLCIWNGANLAFEDVTTWYWTGHTFISSIAVGDIDGDTQMEIITGGDTSNNAQLCVWDGATLACEDVTTWYWTSSTYINSIAVGDVDNDGHMEIVTGGRHHDGTRYAAQLCTWEYS